MPTLLREPEQLHLVKEGSIIYSYPRITDDISDASVFNEEKSMKTQVVAIRDFYGDRLLADFELQPMPGMGYLTGTGMTAISGSLTKTGREMIEEKHFWLGEK